ncbi:MAG: TonB protein [Gemmatimonadetes bacterium]|nr:TonB protein [Gemmatimonadota bacterium]
MRYWLHSASHMPAFAQSTTLSVAVHIVLIGGAIYSTDVNARALSEEVAQRIAYLPPPDRRPSSAASSEQLHYMDIGTPFAGEGSSVASARTVSPKGTLDAIRRGSEASINDAPSHSSIPVESKDSVYSILEVEQGASRTAESAAPVYPPELIKDGKEGGVFIRFIVDTTGHADPASIEVIRATHPLFAESVTLAIPLMAFHPAMIGGHPVRQAVEQNFQFKITRLVPLEPKVVRKPGKPGA